MDNPEPTPEEHEQEGTARHAQEEAMRYPQADQDTPAADENADGDGDDAGA